MSNKSIWQEYSEKIKEMEEHFLYFKDDIERLKPGEAINYSERFIHDLFPAENILCLPDPEKTTEKKLNKFCEQRGCSSYQDPITRSYSINKQF